MVCERLTHVNGINAFDNLNSLSSLRPLSVSSQLLDFPKRHLHRCTSFLAIFFLIIIIIIIIINIT